MNFKASSNVLYMPVGVVVILFMISSSDCVPIKGDYPPNIRDLIITKHNFKQRQKKEFKLPKPFVITSSLKISSNKDELEDLNSRKGRQYVDKNDGAIVVEGVRVPDDETDRITWRNGRVINNIFVPEYVKEEDLPEVTITSKPLNRRRPRKGRTFPNPPFYFDQLAKGKVGDNMAMESEQKLSYELPPSDGADARDYNYRDIQAGNTENGRPVYYVVEEPDSLHSDRSPYNYEPADSTDSNIDKINHFTRNGVTHASNGDFVIQEQTYSMCPGCPSFSIPVPIPKASFINSEDQQQSNQLTKNPNQKYQYARNETFLEKIGNRIISTMTELQNKILGDKSSNSLENVLQSEDKIGDDTASDENSLTNGISEKLSDVTGVDSEYVPVIAAGAAVAAIGGLAYLATSLQNMSFVVTPGKRSFGSSIPSLIIDDVDDIIEKFQEEFDQTPQCMPMNKCFILLKNAESSPEIIYAKKYYKNKFGKNSEELDICELLSCLDKNEKSQSKENLTDLPVTAKVEELIVDKTIHVNH